MVLIEMVRVAKISLLFAALVVVIVIARIKLSILE
jgi:hypothetical protein